MSKLSHNKSNANSAGKILASDLISNMVINSGTLSDNHISSADLYQQALNNSANFSKLELANPEIAAFNKDYINANTRGPLDEFGHGALKTASELGKTLVNVANQFPNVMSEGKGYIGGNNYAIKNIENRVLARNENKLFDVDKYLAKEHHFEDIRNASDNPQSLMYSLPEFIPYVAAEAKAAQLLPSFGSKMANVASSAATMAGTDFAVSKALGQSNDEASANALFGALTGIPIGLLNKVSKVQKNTNGYNENIGTIENPPSIIGDINTHQVPPEGKYTFNNLNETINNVKNAFADAGYKLDDIDLASMKNFVSNAGEKLKQFNDFAKTLSEDFTNSSFFQTIKNNMSDISSKTKDFMAKRKYGEFEDAEIISKDKTPEFGDEINSEFAPKQADSIGSQLSTQAKATRKISELEDEIKNIKNMTHEQMAEYKFDNDYAHAFNKEEFTDAQALEYEQARRATIEALTEFYRTNKEAVKDFNNEFIKSRKDRIADLKNIKAGKDMNPKDILPDTATVEMTRKEAKEARNQGKNTTGANNATRSALNEASNDIVASNKSEFEHLKSQIKPADRAALDGIAKGVKENNAFERGSKDGLNIDRTIAKYKASKIKEFAGEKAANEYLRGYEAGRAKRVAKTGIDHELEGKIDFQHNISESEFNSRYESRKEAFGEANASKYKKGFESEKPKEVKTTKTAKPKGESNSYAEAKERLVDYKETNTGKSTNNTKSEKKEKKESKKQEKQERKAKEKIVKEKVDENLYGVDTEDYIHSFNHTHKSEIDAKESESRLPDEAKREVDNELSSSKVFDKVDSFKIESIAESNYSAYFNSVNKSVHIKPFSNALDSTKMLTSYVHESIHKLFNMSKDKGAALYSKLDKLAKEKFDRSFTNTDAYSSFYKDNKVGMLEEEFTHYIAMKSVMNSLKDEKLIGQIYSKEAMAKFDKFNKFLNENKAFRELADQLEYAVSKASKDESTYLNKLIKGEDNPISNTINKLNEIDKGLAESLGLGKDINLPKNSFMSNFFSSISKENIAKQFNELKSKVVSSSDKATVYGNAIMSHVRDIITSKSDRIDMTNYILKNDYVAIRGIKNAKEANAKAASNMLRIKDIVKSDSIASKIHELSRLLSDALHGDLAALNNPRMLTNSDAIIHNVTKGKLSPELTAELSKLVDENVSIMAMNKADKLSGGKAWEFVGKNQNKEWFNESLDLINFKNTYAKNRLFTENPYNYWKGYSKESYSSPYTYKNVDGELKKVFDVDADYRQGALPLSIDRATKGHVETKYANELRNMSEKEKIDFLEKEQLGAIYDTNGNIIKARKFNVSESMKQEIGKVEDFSDVIGGTYASMIKKNALLQDVIPHIKNQIESGESLLISSKEKEGFVKVSDYVLSHLPHELRDVVKYVDKDYAHMLEGNIEAGYKGAEAAKELSESIWNDALKDFNIDEKYLRAVQAGFDSADQSIKVAQTVWKDIVNNFKDNVVRKNPVSWANAFMFNVAIGLQEGIKPAFMFKNMKEGLAAYKQMREIQRKIVVGVANGKMHPTEVARLTSILENNLLYKLNQEGMTMTILSDIVHHPDVAKSFTDKYMFSKMKDLFGQETAENIANIAKNIYLHPHSKFGQIATDVMTKIDVMGRYAIAKHSMIKDGLDVKAAANKSNAVFGDFDKVTPIWVQYAQEFGAIPFAGWFFRVAPGITKSIKDNPAKAMLVFASLYAAQSGSGKRTEGYNPLATVAYSPFDMTSASPLLNPENFASNATTPQIYHKASRAVETNSPSAMLMSNVNNFNSNNNYKNR